MLCCFRFYDGNKAEYTTASILRAGGRKTVYGINKSSSLFAADKPENYSLELVMVGLRGSRVVICER